MSPKFSASKIVFSDGTEVPLEPASIVLFVGPNNVGKSAALKAVQERARDIRSESPVLMSVEFAREGSVSDVEKLCKSVATKSDPGHDQYQYFGKTLSLSNLALFWELRNDGLRDFTELFVHRLKTEERITAADPVDHVDYQNQGKRHPMHFLHQDDGLLCKLNDLYESAFGEALIVNYGAGRVVRLHSGLPPKISEGEDRVSKNYLRALEKVPTLESQGDGMRSFAGILLHVFAGNRQVLLIDEPEAFLHPPQARILGRALSSELAESKQLLIATHSIDVLKGLLHGQDSRVNVIRLRRASGKNIANVLNAATIQSVLADSLLRHSNILDGVFHERVVLCEGDSDCRFYELMLEQVSQHADFMFTHCGGKHRMPMVIRALRTLGVPTTVVCDIDVLNDKHPLQSIVESLGGDWSAIYPNWKKVRDAIESKNPSVDVSTLVQEFESIVKPLDQRSPLPKQSKKDIQSLLRKSSPWSILKSTGELFIPSGQPTEAYSLLKESLRILGVRICPVGEVEGFCKEVGGHGPRWLNGVLTRDLSDAQFENARSFVGGFADSASDVTD